MLKGRVEGLRLLASPTVPEDNRQALVVDFREIFSLPHDYLGITPNDSGRGGG